jgi:hypothetical protein
MISAKLAVPAGGSLHVSGGERFSPWHACRTGITSSAWNAELVSVRGADVGVGGSGVSVGGAVVSVGAGVEVGAEVSVGGGKVSVGGGGVAVGLVADPQLLAISISRIITVGSRYSLFIILSSLYALAILTVT